MSIHTTGALRFTSDVGTLTKLGDVVIEFGPKSSAHRFVENSWEWHQPVKVRVIERASDAGKVMPPGQVIVRARDMGERVIETVNLKVDEKVKKILDLLFNENEVDARQHERCLHFLATLPEV